MPPSHEVPWLFILLAFSFGFLTLVLLTSRARSHLRGTSLDTGEPIVPHPDKQIDIYVSKKTKEVWVCYYHELSIDPDNIAYAEYSYSDNSLGFITKAGDNRPEQKVSLGVRIETGIRQTVEDASFITLHGIQVDVVEGTYNIYSEHVILLKKRSFLI